MKLFHKGCQGAPRLGRYHLTASVHERKKGKKDQKEKRDKRKLQHTDGGRIFWRSLSKYAWDTRVGHSAQGFVSSPQSPSVSESWGSLNRNVGKCPIDNVPRDPSVTEKGSDRRALESSSKKQTQLTPQTWKTVVRRRSRSKV